MVEPPTVRLAESEGDRELVFGFRYEMYCEGQHLFLDVADHARRQLTDPEDEHALIWLAEDDEQVVGTLRANVGDRAPFSRELRETFDLDRFAELVGAHRISVLSRFIAAPHLRGGAVTGGLMAQAAQYGIDHGIDVVFCDCEPHLVGLYTRIGFRPFKPLYNHPTSGLLVPLVLLLADRDHLVRMNSLLLYLLPDEFPRTAEPELLQLVGSDVVGPPDATLFADFEQRAGGGGDAPISLLDGLSDEERARVLDKSNVLNVRTGDALIRDGHTSRTVYLVLEGTVEIVVGQRLLAVALPGDFFGEFAMLLDVPRTAEARAASEGRVLAVSDRVLQRLIEDEPAIASTLLLNFSRGLARKLLDLRKRAG